MAESGGPIIGHKHPFFVVILNKLHEANDFFKNIFFSSDEDIIMACIINVPKLIATILFNIAKQGNTMLNLDLIIKSSVHNKYWTVNVLN